MATEMQITFGTGLKVDAEYRGFRIATDQPARAGGDGSAPEPYTLFLASMGTCAGIYVLSYLKNHGLPTEGVRLVQSMEFDPESRRLAKVDLKIVVPPGFPERHRKAVERSAELCAVKKAIQDPPTFVIHSEEEG